MNALVIPGAPEWFNAMLNLSLQATLLAGLVWIVLKAVGRWIPPSWRALMWFLVIARVLIPYSPPSPFSLQNLFTTEPIPASAPVVQEALRTAPFVFPLAVEMEMPVETISSSYAAPLSPAQTKPISYTRVFTVVWGGLALFLIALLVTRALVIRYRLVRHGLPAPTFILELLRACCLELRLRYPIRVTASDRIVAPALTGLIPARLIIPAAFETARFEVSEIRRIFLHELAHIQQGHLVLHWLGLIARAVHWFNPAIHFAAMRMRQECELAADAAALRNATTEERAAYGETMLKVLANSIAPPTLLALGMAEHARYLKQRLKALTEPAPARSYILAIFLMCALIISGLSSASPTTQAQASTAPSNDSWVREIAMQGNPELPTQFSTPHATTKVVRRTTAQEARRLILSGDIEGAEGLLQRAVNDGTLDSVAVEHTTTITPITNVISIAANQTDTNSRTVSPAQKRLLEKLATIRIDEFPLVSEVDLVEVVKELASEVRRRDPASGGINLIVSQPTSLGPSGAPVVDVERFQVRFDPPIRDVTLGQLFDAIVRVAKPPPGAPANARLKFSIEDYGVYFSLQTANAPQSPNVVPSAAGRQKLSQKLDAIQLDEYPLPAPVEALEVLKELSAEARRRDPERHGVNFIIDTTQARAANPAIDLENFTIKIDPPVRNVSMRHLCDLIVKRAAPPKDAPANARLKYSIEDYAVVFSLDLEEKEKDPKHSSARPAPVGTLVREARVLIEGGKLDEAEIKLKEAVKIDPEHRMASSYLDLIKEQRSQRAKLTNNVERSWNKTPGGELLSQPNPFATTNSVHTSPSRQALYRKLESLRIDDFPLKAETDLRDVFKKLGSEIRKRDPNGRGINIILVPAPMASSNSPVQIDALTGVVDPVRSELDPGDFKIKFDPPIRDVTLRQFLDAIVMIAKPPQPPPATVGLRYSVEDYGILFSVRPKEEQFVSRAFKVNPNTFRQGLESIWFAPQLRATADGTIKSNFQQEIRDFFVAAGVEFATTNVAVGGAVPRGFGIASPVQQQQKAIFFNERAGVLYVRGTLRDLDIIENALHAINSPPQILKIEVRIFETSAANMPVSVRAIMPKAPTPIEFPMMSIANVGYLSVEQNVEFSLAAVKNSSTVTAVTNFSVETSSGRQIRIPLSKGSATSDQRHPSLDVIVISDARPASGLSVSPIVTTLEPVREEVNKFRVRQATLPATKLNTGETLVLAGPALNSKAIPVLGEIEHVGSLFTKPDDETGQRVWLILLTPSFAAPGD